MSRKVLTWANKEVETFLCILEEEDMQRKIDGAVFIVFILFIVFIEQATLCRAAMMSRCLRSCRGDQHSAYHKGTVGGGNHGRGNVTSELSWAITSPH